MTKSNVLRMLSVILLVISFYQVGWGIYDIVHQNWTDLPLRMVLALVGWYIALLMVFADH